MDETSAADHALLGPDDPPPYTIENPDAASALVLVCDHASNVVPAALGRLGLPEGELARHIAWDEGAAAVTRGLAARLDATAVLAGFSRLVIDCNRQLDHETSIPEVSDATPIAGNAGLGAAERARRAAAIFEPYHAAVAAALDRVRGRGRQPALIGVHSFTPELAGAARPWQVAVLWAEDGRVARPLLAALERRGDLVVGDNVPYSGREHYGYTVDVHGQAAGIPHALVEMRADEVSTEAGVHRYVDLLAGALGEVLGGLGIATGRRGGPRR